MDFLITGGTGFLGRALIEHLLAQEQHRITVLSRFPEKVENVLGSLRQTGRITAVQHLSELDAHHKVDVIINLAGAPIADQRWSDARKQTLRNSRIDITHDLVAFVLRSKHKPALLLSGSAVGYYGDQKDRITREDTPAHNEFTHQLCRDWEQAAQAAEDLGVRVVTIRTGLVVGPDGGFLKRMLLPFKLGLGGPFGKGDQWMPWIHRQDWIRIVDFIIAHESLHGPINATAPTPVRNAEFARVLASILHRPARFTLPAWVLELLMGEMSRLLLTGQQAIPEKLTKAGFQFSYPELGDALTQVLTPPGKGTV